MQASTPMSLAEASEARKARLIALRRRKAGEVDGYDIRIPRGAVLISSCCSDGSIIKNRNYDPESRTLKKHTHEDALALEDTVEKNVQGLAQKIILEDEQRRAQELVSSVQSRLQPRAF